MSPTTTTVAPPAAETNASFRLLEGSPEEARLLGLIEASKEQRRRLDAQIVQVSATLSALRHEVSAVDSQLRATERQVAELQALVEERSRQLAEAADSLRELAVAAYVHGSAPVNGLVEVVARGGSTSELEMAANYARAATVNRAAAVRRLRASRDDLRKVREALDETVRASARQRDGATARTTAEADATRRLTQLRDEVSAVVARQEDLVGRVLASRDEFEARFRALAEESETIRARLAGLPARAPGAAGTAASLSPPLPALRPTSTFGPRVHPVYGTVRMHNGLDLAAEAGTPVYAAADGVVVSAGHYGGYGTTAVIDHGDATATLYAHQRRLSVSEGQAVSRGQVIGEVGCTGLCTGPHLHFEVRVGGEPVDPAGWIRQR